MSGARKFEDLIAWQKAREMTKLVYETTRQGAFARDFSFSNQMQRAAVSVMSNIAEGFQRNGRAEFLHFLSVARASCAEVRSHLYVALDINYLDESKFEQMMGLAEEAGRLVSGLRISVERQQKASTAQSKL